VPAHRFRASTQIDRQRSLGEIAGDALARDGTSVPINVILRMRCSVELRPNRRHDPRLNASVAGLIGERLKSFGVLRAEVAGQVAPPVAAFRIRFFSVPQPTRLIARYRDCSFQQH